MTEPVEPPKPLWGMPLHGVPCDSCMEPADGMLVFDDKRLVVHSNRALPPCEGLNPVPTPPRPKFPTGYEGKRQARAAKRRAANPRVPKR